MAIIAFLIVLSALILVHEVGHFVAAKRFGIRVDEFGLGYPPRIGKVFSWRGTVFTLNWLPFGGFVKIFGESPSEVRAPPVDTQARPSNQLLGLAWQDLPPYSFQAKHRGIQATVLAAGVAGNLVFSWLLLSVGFLVGLPAPASFPLPVENPRPTVTAVLPDSPAALADLHSGDVILEISRGVETLRPTDETRPEEVSNFIGRSAEPVDFVIERGETELTKSVKPVEGIAERGPAVGILVDSVGTARSPFPQALWHGLVTTANLTTLTAVAIGDFIFQALGGRADLSLVAGPVGIVGLVSSVHELGLVHLMVFTALLSINLAIINLLPFPALDGGRLLFVAIEAVTRRPIPPKLFNALNAVGFALLIFLMILITLNDIRNIF